MRVFSETTVTMPQLNTVQCNKCGKDVTKNTVGYFEDHVSLTKNWGYHSPYDGEAHAIDLCVDCYKDWTSQFQIPPSVEPFNII